MLPPGRARACNNSGRHWISGGHHDDRNSAARFFGFQSIVGNGRNDDVDLKPDEIGDESRKAIVSSIRVSILDGDILSFSPSQVREPAQKGLMPGCCISRGER